MGAAGRVAVVTGGSSGIGFGIVRGLLASGACVAFCGSSRQTVGGAMAALAVPDRTAGMVLDVADHDAVAAFFTEVRVRFGPVDILVNNAGVSPKRRSPDPWISQVTLAEWRRVVDVNLTGAWLCAHAAAPDMIARRWGRIVNIGSIAGRTTPKIAGPHYAAAKAGLGGLTRALAVDLAPHGVTVNCLAPGWITSNMTAAKDSPRAREAAATIPVGRVGEPSDMAAAVGYLISDAASYVTGTTLDINGGLYAT